MLELRNYLFRSADEKVLLNCLYVTIINRHDNVTTANRHIITSQSIVVG